MKTQITLALIIFYISLGAQSNTEVFLLDITKEGGKIILKNPKNISNNEGYDNQPSFYDNNSILFSSTRDRQTDIALYNIKEGSTSWISNTKIGSEYSPLKIPNKETVSAVRLDSTGLQRLYEYTRQDTNSKELLKELKVGYYVWYNDHVLVSSVLADDRMDLVVSNLKKHTNDTIEKNVGRSLHKIPNSDLVSFISKENETWMIKSFNPISGDIKEITSIPLQIEDMCWTVEGSILMTLGKEIASFDTQTERDWKVLHHFEEDEIHEISRLTISPDGKHLAVVSDESPAISVQKQVDSFNKRELKSFVSCFSDEVIVKNFPVDTMYVGKSKLIENYKKFFANNPNAKVAVIKRIVVGNKVIDEELVTIKGKKNRQVAIYEVKNGKIISMTFIHEKKTVSEAEPIVQAQLDAYNVKDIDAFTKTFTDSIVAYDYPHKLSFKGQEQLHTMFSGFFTQTPDLHCEIKNRIVLGNIVIDDEYITANGNLISSVAIYEIENGKIAKMIFLR